MNQGDPSRQGLQQQRTTAEAIQLASTTAGQSSDLQPDPTTILFATDGTAASAAARTAAAQLARAGNAALHVVYVSAPSTAPGGGHPAVDEAVAKAIAAEQARTLEEGSGSPVAGVHTPHEWRVEGILRVAYRVGAGLVVVGGRRITIVEEFFTYRVSEGVAHRSLLPLLVVPVDSPEWPPRHIVVGYDGSPEARRASHLAEWIARLSDADVRLVRVLEPSSSPTARREAELRVKGAAAYMGTRLSSDRVSAQVVTSSDVAGVLREACAAAEGTMLAIGARGIGPLRRAQHASVSETVAHHSRIPLVLAPPAGPER
jgi:nucleotide-binding universal stress UspA family protein